MPSIAPYKKARMAHKERRDKDRMLRKQTAFNIAVSLKLGDSPVGWTASPDGETVTRHKEGKQDRTYKIDQQALESKVGEVKKEREEKVKVEAEKKAKEEAKAEETVVKEVEAGAPKPEVQAAEAPK